MAKIEVGIDYLNAVDRFKTLLSTLLVAPENVPNVVSLSVDVNNGRKFDRVRVGVSYQKGSEVVTEWGVRFFINRTNGSIYGRKSDLAPNTKWFFGDVYSLDEWNWTENGATPKDETKYRVVSEYKPYKHYERV